MISYTKFSLGYFYLSPLFFIFYNVAQNNRFNFISNYGRKQPPNNGRRTGCENEFLDIGEKKQQGKTWLWWFCTVCQLSIS